MSNIIAAMIGALALISSVILAAILKNKKYGEPILKYIKKKLPKILIIFFLLTIILLSAYIYFLNFKLENQEEKKGDRGIESLAKIFADYKLDMEIKFRVTRERDSLNLKRDNIKIEKAELEEQLKGLQDSEKIDYLNQEIKKRDNIIEYLEGEIDNKNKRIKELEDELKRKEKLIKERKDGFKILKETLELIEKSTFQEENNSTIVSNVVHKLVVWSSDNKYVAVMYYYKDVGNISIIDLSSKEEINNISIEKPYGQISFSQDNKKIIADEKDTFEITKEELSFQPSRPNIPIESENEDIPEDEKIENIELDTTELPPLPPPPPTDEEAATIFVPWDEPPQPIGGFAAIQRNLVYPESARKAGIEGKVTVHVLIDEKGTVCNTKILVSLGNNGCDEAAVAAIKSVKWKPAMQRDRPVKVWAAIPVVFKLKKESLNAP